MATTELAVHGEAVSRYDRKEIIDTIRQTVAKGANDAQLKMFLEVCKRTGLDPFLKEIWYVPEKGMIMAGRDGYLRVANENPNFDGMDTRVERDAKNLPVKAVCTVYRKDRSHPVIAEAYFNEYRGNSPVWTKYPSAMISKVAEVLALKRSFSINGVVTEEEMGDQGGSHEAAQAVAQEKIDVMQRKIDATKAAHLADLKQFAGLEITPALPAPSAIIDGECEDVPAKSDAEALHDDIVNHPPKETKRERAEPLTSKRIRVLQEFGKFKKRYKAIGKESEYYAVLGRNGVEHSDEFPDTEEGLEKARAVYSEMRLNLADLEAWAKAQEQPPAA